MNLEHGFISYLGAGILGLVIYFIVSNTLWLLLGSRLLQSFPGVGDKSLVGTLRIALMVIAVVVGILTWLFKKMLFSKIGFLEQLSQNIQYTSRMVFKIGEYVSGLKKSRT